MASSAEQGPPPRIPFNRPFVAGRELFYIAQAVEQGHLAGDGAFSLRCCAWMERRFGTPRAMLTPSCTAALEMAALLCEVGPGDEVILPSFTFVSTANAFCLRGARPVFVDIREDTLNLDERLLEAAVTERTRVVVPVHYAGVACEMEPILDLARRRGLFVVEDAAQAMDSRLDGRFLGTLGDLGCLSFHETKNVITGEGGALLVNNERMIRRAEVIREKGTDRKAFFRGEVDKYTWVDVGSSYLPSELVGAFLAGQLDAFDAITKRRREIFAYYARHLAPLERDGCARLPRVPGACLHNGHLFYLLLADEAARNSLLEHLRSENIGSVFHYVPLHTSPMGRRLGYAPGDLPVTESASARLLRLPCFFGLEEAQQERVVESVLRWARETCGRP